MVRLAAQSPAALSEPYAIRQRQLSHPGEHLSLQPPPPEESRLLEDPCAIPAVCIVPESECNAI
jgi:hypothetical protein